MEIGKHLVVEEFAYALSRALFMACVSSANVL
jgi:hypothetical protein